MTHTPYGFWIVGSVHGARVLVDASRAFAGFAACDARARIDGEHFLSAFSFGDDLRVLADPATLVVPVKGFSGPCGAAWVWWDIDRPGNLAVALIDARALCIHLADQLGVDQTDILVYYSGSKGFHVGIPSMLWTPSPSVTFHTTTRRFAESVAASAGGPGITIDTGVYDKVRAFRAPNSRHPATGLYKRRLSVDELLGLDLDRISALAVAPAPFDVPAPTKQNSLLAAAWREADTSVTAEQAAARQHRNTIAAAGGPDRLNRSTIDFIIHGALVGDRHRLLFSAAANLAEFGCPPTLAHALLTEAALNSGLRPADVRRQIECGLAHPKDMHP